MELKNMVKTAKQMQDFFSTFAVIEDLVRKAIVVEKGLEGSTSALATITAEVADKEERLEKIDGHFEEKQKKHRAEMAKVNKKDADKRAKQLKEYDKAIAEKEGVLSVIRESVEKEKSELGKAQRQKAELQGQVDALKLSIADVKLEISSL